MVPVFPGGGRAFPYANPAQKHGMGFDARQSAWCGEGASFE
jgi:hypothetical protein